MGNKDYSFCKTFTLFDFAPGILIRFRRRKKISPEYLSVVNGITLFEVTKKCQKIN
jgi:hypothetical protein